MATCALPGETPPTGGPMARHASGLQDGIPAGGPPTTRQGGPRILKGPFHQRPAPPGIKPTAPSFREPGNRLRSIRDYGDSGLRCFRTTVIPDYGATVIPCKRAGKQQ